MNYIGDNIQIEEMPQGCIVTQNIYGEHVEAIRISSKDDALALISSLKRMIEVQYE